MIRLLYMDKVFHYIHSNVMNMFNFISVSRACDQNWKLLTLNVNIWEKAAYQRIHLHLACTFARYIFPNTFDNSKQKCLSGFENARVWKRFIKHWEALYVECTHRVRVDLRSEKKHTTFYKMFTFEMFIMLRLTFLKAHSTESYFLVYILIETFVNLCKSLP